jgi:hypothetical protein
MSARLLMLLLAGRVTSAVRFLGLEMRYFIPNDVFPYEFRHKSTEKFARIKKKLYLCTRKTEKKPIFDLLRPSFGM